MDFQDTVEYTISGAGGNQDDTSAADGILGAGAHHRQCYSTVPSSLSSTGVNNPQTPLPPPFADDPRPQNISNSQLPIDKPTTAESVNFCSNCGNQITFPSNNFCPDCGHALRGSLAPLTPDQVGHIASRVTTDRPVEQNRWATSIARADECDGCVLGFCAPCIMFGQIAEIVDKGERSCLTYTILYSAAMFLGVNCLYSFRYRTKMRAAFNLRDDPCHDIFTHLFCEPCALSQEHRELHRRGIDPAAGFSLQQDIILKQMEMKAPAPSRMKRPVASTGPRKTSVAVVRGVRAVFNAFFG